MRSRVGNGTDRRGSGRGARLGAGNGGSCGGGGGKARGIGTAGLISSALGLLGQLISARRRQQNPDVGRIQGVDGAKANDSLTTNRALPNPPRSPKRQARNDSFFASVCVEKCTGCGICAQICPVGAIAVEQAACVDITRCTGCGQCVAECPQDALTMKKA